MGDLYDNRMAGYSIRDKGNQKQKAHWRNVPKLRRKAKRTKRRKG